MAKRLGRRFGLLSDRGAIGFRAAFRHQEPNQAPHHRIVGTTDQGRRVALLADEAHDDQGLQVMGKRRRRDRQSALQFADSEARISGPQ